MKRSTRLLAILMALTICLAFVFAGCKKADDNNGGGGGGGDDTPAEVTNAEGVTELKLYAFTEEIPTAALRYTELFPDFGFTIKETIIPTDGGQYQTSLDAALAGGGADAPDIYTAEAAFVKKYTQGDRSNHAGTYKSFGIDVAKMTSESQIAQYGIDIGTRDGELVGLAYQATGGAMIYRRSIALDTWGTDDPDEVAKKVGPGWDQFWVAAEELKAKGYAIVSGDGDIWHSVENSSDAGWINSDGKLYIDPKREAFFDMSKKLKDNDYHNDTTDWSDAWTADMKGEGPKQVFAFFGPAWFINYCMPVQDTTFGDWAVAVPPVGFFWGGTWLIGNKDTKIPKAVGDLITWFTLDSSDKGMQTYWANGNLFADAKAESLQGKKQDYADGKITKDTVSSKKVMDNADGTLDLLGGQDMFKVFGPANEAASGKCLTQYDEGINNLWRDQVREYTAGNKTKDEAINEFKQRVLDEFGIEAA